MFCSKCGAQVPDGAAFCSSCGAAVPASGAEGAPNQAGVPDATPTAVVAAEAAAAVPASGAKKFPAKLVGLCAGVVVVAAVAAFGIYSTFFAPYEINDKLFPDEVVRGAVIAQVDPDRDGKITRDEAKAVVMLDIEGAKSIEGLGVFPSLADLTVRGEELTTLNVEDCSQLVNLDASGCSALAEVKLGDKPALQTVLLNGTAVGSLDVSRAPALTTLDVSSAPLAELSVTSNEALTSLKARGTGLQALDVTGNPALTELNIEETAIPSLNLESNSQLSSLRCADAVTLENLSATQLHEFWVVNSLKKTSVFEGEYAEYAEYNSETQYDMEYDSEGRLTRATYDTTSDDSSYGTGYTYEYDDAGQLTTINVYEREDELNTGDPKNVWSLNYDEAGNMTSAYNSEYGSGYSYTYDEQGRLTEKSSGSSSSTDIYRYDEKGLLTQFGSRSSSSSTLWNVSYNEASQVASLAKDPSSSYYSAIAWAMTYGTSTLLETMSLTSDYENNVTTYSYDENGHLANVTIADNSNPAEPYLRSTAFTYDERGFLTTMVPDFNPSYAQDIMAVAKSTYTFGYQRVLTTNAAYLAPQIMNLKSITQPSFEPTFWEPGNYTFPANVYYANAPLASATFAADGSPIPANAAVLWLGASKTLAADSLEASSEDAEPEAEVTA